MGDTIIERARVALAGACKRGYIQMCVPVQADDDDILISAALDHAADLLERVERLEAALRAVRPHIGRCNVRTHGYCYQEDNVSDIEEMLDAALAAVEPAG